MLIKQKTLSGFTLVELLLVIAIIAIVGATAIPIGSAFLVRIYLNNKTNELISSLRTAQMNSINNKENMQWGVETSTTIIKLYADEDSSFNQVFSIPSSISITQDTILFDKLTGNPDTTATFTISSNAGDSAIVTVNEVGTVDVN